MTSGLKVSKGTFGTILRNSLYLPIFILLKGCGSELKFSSDMSALVHQRRGLRITPKSVASQTVALPLHIFSKGSTARWSLNTTFSMRILAFVPSLFSISEMKLIASSNFLPSVDPRPVSWPPSILDHGGQGGAADTTKVACSRSFLIDSATAEALSWVKSPLCSTSLWFFFVISMQTASISQARCLTMTAPVALRASADVPMPSKRLSSMTRLPSQACVIGAVLHRSSGSWCLLRLAVGFSVCCGSRLLA